MTFTDGPKPAICDYEGSGYATDFWQGKGRDYEDAVERIALQKLLPARSQRYVEFGAGFGRLIDEADAYQQVVLVDYSRSLLQQAQDRLGRSERYVYVAADLNNLPFAPNAFDTAIMVRVIHHMPAPLHVLQQVRRTLVPQATFVLEFANKQNLKSILRYLANKQDWSPFDPNPVEFVELNYDFHPGQMREWLEIAGFTPTRTLAVSMFRLGALKRRLPLNILKGLEQIVQPTGAVIPLSPSVFVRNSINAEGKQPVATLDTLFVNPIRQELPLKREGDTMVCPETRMRWAIHDGIYDFKTPLD